MENKLTIYNTLTRKKELFQALNPPHVGMYVCGPTVYGDPHLGHARPAITFDILFRYLQHLGYKVRLLLSLYCNCSLVVEIVSVILLFIFFATFLSSRLLVFLYNIIHIIIKAVTEIDITANPTFFTI